MRRKKIRKKFCDYEIYFVNCVCRDKNNEIVLLGDSFEKWILPTNRVIADIRSSIVYLSEGLNLESRFVYSRIKIFRKDGTQYLKTAPDSHVENNLDNLPSICKKFRSLK